MIKKIVKIFIGIMGALLGYGILAIVKTSQLMTLPKIGWLGLIIDLGVYLFFGIIFFLLSPAIIKLGKKVTQIIENELQKLPAYDIALGSFGLIVGLIIAFFLSKPLENLNIGYLGFIGSIILFGLFGYLGIKIATRKKDDISNAIQDIGSARRQSQGKEKTKLRYNSSPKILDTSVIIDGRIADICSTGFIEGPLVIPEFVLEELQHIADSSDGLKRNRGRRGLDILNKIQKEIDVEIIIHEKKFEDVKEVDSKLLKLTQLMNGKIITNDYNLNKVAEVQGIEVLNINELSNAVKPVVLPGEEMVVTVVRDGKESGQGLAYLDDGTMIVVESGRKYIGDTIEVIVTSVLQTSAGKMIFAKPKSLADKAV
ncbi:PIN/TRAM domain-containing protein [Tissierella creatinophila]|uniref:Putative PIN and TRAM-domain containing protein n=1 Tax=Tissierella creatinophila DSM 6911 TaxID=1123403 RepID=A0A1U7M4J3_TISCR|nr:PIN/TRAM domain-containing protein [Tissierella creatinophila]OLS02170.1 putative PIN and TRAM-domain containing protein precursor [Tissierella creatinophila DSM 6911]